MLQGNGVNAERFGFIAPNFLLPRSGEGREGAFRLVAPHPQTSPAAREREFYVITLAALHLRNR